MGFFDFFMWIILITTIEWHHKLSFETPFSIVATFGVPQLAKKLVKKGFQLGSESEIYLLFGTSSFQNDSTVTKVVSNERNGCLSIVLIKDLSKKLSLKPLEA